MTRPLLSPRAVNGSAMIADTAADLGGAEGIRTPDPLTARKAEGDASSLYQQQQSTGRELEGTRSAPCAPSTTALDHL